VIASADVRDLEATETIIPAGTLDRSSDSRSFKVETRVQWRPPRTTAPRLLVGADLQHGTLESRYREPGSDAVVGAGDVRRLSGGVFALAQLRLREDLAVTGGVRLDWLRSSLDDPTDGAPRGPDDDLRAASPTVAASYALPRRGQLYASWAGAFKAPTLEQLYDRRPYDIDGPGPGPPLFISSNALDPQRGDHFETGARILLAPGLRGELAAYFARSRDEIGFDLANFRHNNIERSEHYGVESQLGVAGPSGTDAQVSYAFTRARFDGGPHDGHQINTVPVHRLHGRMSWEHRWHGSLTAEFTQVARQWIDEDERYELEPYFTVGVGARQAFGAIELQASVRNLFDERYATLGYVTLDPITFGDLPLYFPAARRSFQAGLRIGGGR
jgi:iron complex outermembrane recepter protein